MQTKEEKAAYLKKWRDKNKEKITAYNVKNKEKKAAQKKKWRDNNKERHVAINKKWRAKNPEKIAAYIKKANKKSRENLSDYYVSKRFSKLKNSPCTAKELRQFPDIIETLRLIMKIKRLCIIKNKENENS